MRQEPHRLVFIDETAVKTNLTRLRGRAPVGERLYGTAPFGKWGTQTFIAGLTQDALIAPWVINGPMNGAAFDAYIETQLAPAREPGTVVILDNLSTHKSPQATHNLPLTTAAAHPSNERPLSLVSYTRLLYPSPTPDRPAEPDEFFAVHHMMENTCHNT